MLKLQHISGMTEFSRKWPMLGCFIFLSLAVSTWAKHGNNTVDLVFTNPKEMENGILLRKIGQSVRLICNAQGSPAPQIKWYKDSDELIPFSRGEWTLTLFSLQVGHSGKYKCRVKNADGMISHEYTLLVQEREKPRWLHMKPVVSVERGQTATLVCEVSNWEWWRPPVVLWVKRYSEQQVPTRWQYKDIETAKKKDGTKKKFFYAALPMQPIRELPDGRYASDLVINDVTQRDAGVYYCYAKDRWNKLRKRDAKLVVLPATQANQNPDERASHNQTSTLSDQHSTLGYLLMYIGVALASALLVFFALTCLAYHIVRCLLGRLKANPSNQSADEMELGSVNAVKGEEGSAKNDGSTENATSLQGSTPDNCHDSAGYVKRVNEIPGEIIAENALSVENGDQEKNVQGVSFKMEPIDETQAEDRGQIKNTQESLGNSIRAGQIGKSRRQQAVKVTLNKGASTSRAMEPGRKRSSSADLNPRKKSVIATALREDSANQNASSLQGTFPVGATPVFNDSGYVDMSGNRNSLG